MVKTQTPPVSSPLAKGRKQVGLKINIKSVYNL